MHELVHGEHEDMVAAVAEAQGTPLPDWLENKPVLALGLEFFYWAFWELSSCRAVGFSPGPIPWTAIDQFCRSERLPLDQRRRLHHCIREMDAAFLRHEAKRSKSNDSGSPNAPIKRARSPGRGRGA